MGDIIIDKINQQIKFANNKFFLKILFDIILTYCYKETKTRQRKKIMLIYIII